VSTQKGTILKEIEVDFLNLLNKEIQAQSRFFCRTSYIHFDNYFTSIALVQKFKLAHLASCAIRFNRKGIPTLKDDRELSRGEHDWSARSDGIACVKWKDKHTAILLSSIYSPTDVEEMRRKECDGRVTQISCPKIVKTCTANMGCVNKADMVKTLYATDRKSKRSWLRLFWYFVDISVVNAYILNLRGTAHRSLKVKDFRRNVVTWLVGKKKQCESEATKCSRNKDIQI
jgi:hypothetical protein